MSAQKKKPGQLNSLCRRSVAELSGTKIADNRD